MITDALSQVEDRRRKALPFPPTTLPQQQAMCPALLAAPGASTLLHRSQGGQHKSPTPLLAACSICSSVSPPVVQTRPFPPSHCGADSYGPRSYAQARLQAKSSRVCISGVTLLNFLGKRHGMCKAVWHPRNSTVQWNPVLEVQLREVTSNPTVHPISPLFVLARSLIPGISC